MSQVPRRTQRSQAGTCNPSRQALTGFVVGFHPGPFVQPRFASTPPRYLLEGVQGDSIPDSVRESVMTELRRSFRPEFLNRIDETILFKPLTLEEITTIVDLLLADLNKRLADRRVSVVLDKKAKEWAAEKGYDPVFGARPLKRFLQRQIETKLARALISGEVAEDTTVTFHVRGDELVLEGAPVHV